jgi:hypothetical protein
MEEQWFFGFFGFIGGFLAGWRLMELLQRRGAPDFVCGAALVAGPIVCGFLGLAVHDFLWVRQH